MSRSEGEGSLKGKHRLALGPKPDGFLEHAPIGEVDGSPQDVAKPDFETGEVEQRQAALTVEIAEQVDIGTRRRLAPGDRTEDCKSRESRAPQLILMGAQDSQNFFSIDTSGRHISAFMLPLGLDSAAY
jgi:hypothetical protein